MKRLAAPFAMGIFRLVIGAAIVWHAALGNDAVADQRACGPEFPLACRPYRPPLSDAHLVNMVAGLASPLSYCPSFGGATLYEYISNVDVTLDNNNLVIVVDVVIANPTGCTAGDPCPEYDSSPEYVNAWIDFDGDGNFETQERVMDEAGTGYLNISYQGTMTFIETVPIPSGAVPETTLRVNLGWGEDPNDPCQLDWSWGNVVDEPIQLPRVRVTQLDIAQNVKIREHSNPAWKKIFDADGNLVDVSPPEKDPLADSMSSGSFRLTATLDAFPQKPTWTPSVHYAYSVAPTGVASPSSTGNGAFTGWSGAIRITNPQAVGQYTLTINIDIQDADGNTVATQVMTHVLYVTYGQPPMEPKEAWLQKGTTWAVGSNDAQKVKRNLTYGIYSGGGGLGWQYLDGATAWTSLVEGAASRGNCVSYSSVWHNLCRVLGVSGTGVRQTRGVYYLFGIPIPLLQGRGFVTKPATALDGKMGNAHTLGGAVDRWRFSMHQLGKDGSQYYDPTFGAINAGLNDFIAWHATSESYKEASTGRWRQDLTDGHHVYAVPSAAPWGDNEYHSPGVGIVSPSGDTAEFTGTGTITPVDANGDGKFERLGISADCTLSGAGPFTMGGYVAGAGNVLTSRSSWDAMLPAIDVIEGAAGTVSRYLEFSGQDIRASGTDGPYELVLSILDSNGFVIAETTFESELLSANQFGELPAEIVSVTEMAEDADGDSVYDVVTVEVYVAAFQALTVAVQGAIFSGGQVLAAQETTRVVSPGTTTLALSFDGRDIRKGGVNGPFELQIVLSDNEGPQLDFWLGDTSPYDYLRFANPDVLFVGPFADAGEDGNGNGLFEALNVYGNVVVTDSGSYTLTAWLQTASGDDIAHAEQTRVLPSGQSPLTWQFDGRLIQQKGVDGPYTLVYLLAQDDAEDTVGTLRGVYDTSAYAYSAFEPPHAPLAAVTGNYSGAAHDNDGNGLYDILRIGVEVLATAQGNVIVEAGLVSISGSLLGTAMGYVPLGEGESGWVFLDYPGWRIFANGENGPFLLTNVRAYHTGDPSESVLLEDAYQTENYAAEAFEPAAVIRGTVSLANGQPVAGAVISAGEAAVYSNTTGSYYFGFGGAGTVTVSIDPPAGLPDGPWQITVNGAGAGEGQSIPITVAFGEATEVSFVLGGPEDVTSSCVIQRSGFRYYRAAGQFLQAVKVRNTSSEPLGAPVSLVLSNLSMEVGLANATGHTVYIQPGGTAYIDIPVGTDEVLSPGETVTLTLQFDNPLRTGIMYAPKVFAGPGLR